MFDWITPVALLLFDPVSQMVVVVTLSILGAVVAP